MLLNCFAAVVLCLQLQNGNPIRIWIENNELWAQTTGRPMQLSHHGRPKGEPLASPDGKRIVYVSDQPTSNTGTAREAIVEINVSGGVPQTLVPNGHVPGPIDKLEWIDNRRIGVMTCGRVNCFYWVLDADSGETLKVMQGGFEFMWSHNSQWVARRFTAEFETIIGQPFEDDDSLTINDTQFYPRETGVSGPRRKPEHSHVFGPFTWSPNDKWLSFTDTVSPEGDPYVVLVSPTGKILREIVSTDVRYDAKVDWIDDDHLQLSTGEHTFKFVVDGNRLLEVTTK